MSARTENVNEPTLPNDGRPQPHKGANPDAMVWKVVPMRDDPTLFKIVDDRDTNVADQFHSQANAEQYVAFHIFKQSHHDQPTGDEDKFGVKKIKADVSNGKWFDSPNYKRSSHNTGTRDTFSMEVGEMLNLESTGYFTVKATKDSEELSIKIFGGNHTGDGDNDETRQGRCYGLGVGFSGRPQIYKEFPHHAEGSKHLDKAVFSGQLGQSIGEIRGRNFGLKIISYIKPETPNQVNFECWIDNKGIVNGKPTNDWKLFYTCVDKGDWAGEPYLENQGIKHGGKGIYYVRIDTVTDKTVADFVSVREIKP